MEFIIICMIATNFLISAIISILLGGVDIGKNERKG